MKKNLRIVSAAAAALLAVAPVAATGLNTVVSAASATATSAEQVTTDGAFTIDSTKDASGKEVEVPAYSSTSNGGKTIDKASEYKITYSLLGGNKQLKVINADAIKETTNSADSNYVQVEYTQNNGATVKAWINAKAAGLTYHKAAGTFEGSNVYLRAEEDGALANEGAYANNGTIYAGAATSQTVTDLSSLKKAVMSVVSLGYDESNGSFKRLSLSDWDKYVWNDGSATNDANLISQLSKQGVYSNGKITGGSFHVDVNTNGGNAVRVVFEKPAGVSADAPVIIYRSDMSIINGGTGWTPVNGHVLTIMRRDSGTFQPTEYFGAWENAGKHGRISVTASDNNVDWTKNGLYSITISATNQAGKTTKTTIPVIVTDIKGEVKTVVNNTNIYTEQNGAMTQANLVNFRQTVYPGSQLVVYGSPVTKKLNGKDEQFYRIVSPSSNFWVKASDLKGGQTNNNNNHGVAQTGTVTIMHAAYTYQIKDGKLGSRVTSADTLHAYSEVPVYGTVTVNGKKYYRVSATEDWYINAGNVDGKSRSLKHNSYVYNNKGKRVKSEGTWKKGSSHTTYGAAMNIKGSRMYRVNRNRYVKVVNFN